jgi:hypothetical protein
MNGLQASSEDPIQEKVRRDSWGRPGMILDSPGSDAKTKARDMLLRELKRIKDEVVVNLCYEQGLRDPSVAGIDQAVVPSFEILGKPLLTPLMDPRFVLASFVGNATQFLPNEPVSVGAVWHATLPNPQMPDDPWQTAIKLESVTSRGLDQIAVLQTTAYKKIKGPKKIRTPLGETVDFKDCSLELSGTVVLNLTRQAEENSESVMGGTYTILQGGQSAKCDVKAAETTERHSQEVSVSQSKKAQ